MHSRVLKLTSTLIITLLCIFALEGCDPFLTPPLSKPLGKQNFMLDTYVSITLYDKGSYTLIDKCFELIQSYEDKFSRTISGSEISTLNEATVYPVTVSDDTSELIDTALYYAKLTDGAFDPTIEPVSSLWDFKSPKPTVPTDNNIITNLKNVGYKNIIKNNNEISLTNPDSGLDLGAIAKGYIADRVKDYLLENGVHSAVINLGGNVLCVGNKPDGSDFRIGIQKPFENYAETVCTVGINDMTVVSSGIYERYFVQDGVLYHHILNPATGYPYDNELTAVTIITNRSVDGDALSTSCFALGSEKGLALINSLSDTYAAFILKDGSIVYSDGFDSLIISED